MNRSTTLLIMVLLALAVTAAPRTKNNILTIKETITDNDIVFPESFETDTRELMKNWYLQNYTVLDADVENRSTGEVNDDEYIKRLKAMPTVIEMPYNQVVRSYIDRYVKRNRTLVEEMLGMSLYYMPIFEQALEKEGLPMELKYLPVIESALDPNAVSRAGAAGLWQFMVGTGKGLGLEVNSLVDERRDPYKSSEKAATYLKNLYSIYGDWSLAIAAYNCGPGNVNKALRRAGGENQDFWEIYSYLPRETRGYVPAFIAANYIMTYFKRHNISPSLASKPLITDTVGVTQRVNFNQISKVLNMPIEEIRALNPQYRHDVIPGTSERSYTLVLPSQQVYSYIMSEDSIVNYRSDIYAQRDVVEPVGTTATASTDNTEYTYETKTVTEYHKVRRGETYSSIASKYGMTLNSLLTLNGMQNGKARRGQVVKVQTQKKVRVPKTENYVSDEDIRVVHGNDYSLELTENNAESGTEAEKEQIEEVRRIEQAAATSQRTTHKVETEVPAKPKPKAAPSHETPGNSKQWHKRNERYADKNSRHKSREDNYKNTRSSGKRGERAGRRQKHEAQPAKPVDHTIKKGETLSEISEKTGVSVKELKAANGIKGDNIKAGDNIKIPAKGGKAAKGSNAKTSSKKSSGKASAGKSAGKTGGKKSRKKK